MEYPAIRMESTLKRRALYELAERDRREQTGMIYGTVQLLVLVSLRKMTRQTIVSTRRAAYRREARSGPGILGPDSCGLK